MQSYVQPITQQRIVRGASLKSGTVTAENMDGSQYKHSHTLYHKLTPLAVSKEEWIHRGQM